MGVNKSKDKNIKKKAKNVNNKKVKKNTKNIDKKNTIFNLKNKPQKKTIIVILILFLIVVFSIVGLYKFIMYKEQNNEFSKKIKVWGFDTLYSNGQTYSWENISKIEAIKIIIGATKNTNSMQSLYSTRDEQSDDEKALFYANYKELIDDDKITSENMYNKATVLDVYMLIDNCRKNILEKEITKSVIPNYKDFEEYTELEQYYILSVLSQDLIRNNNKNLKADKVIKKGELNEIIYNYVYKYSTLASEGEKMVNDPSKLPANHEEYPYILESVPKEVYEQSIEKVEDTYYHNAAEFFDMRRKYYASTKYISTTYFNALLNVDYETITYDSLKNSIKDFVVGSPYDSTIQEYVDYVKENKIKISGNAAAQMPIIYNDGEKTRIRLKLEFSIDSSNTNVNLLCFDSMYGNEVVYNNKSYILYIDAEMRYVLGTEKAYNSQVPIYTMLLDMSKNKLEINDNLYVNLISVSKEGAVK